MRYRRKNNDTAEMKFYGTISTWWNGADDFTSTLNEIQSAYKNLEIKLHCYGGEVFEGSAIYNAISQSSLNITWEIVGIAASMASIVMLAKGDIKMCENAFVMIHVPSAITIGNANDHFSTGKLLKNMQQNFSKAYARKTGKSETDVDAWLDGTDHWFNADECLALKLVDEIIPPIDEAPPAKPDSKTTVENVYARYTAILSQNNFIENKKQKMDKQSIVQKFNLSVSADASDTAVLDALCASFTKKDERILALEKEQKENLSTQANALIEMRAKALNVVFTDDQKESFKKVAESAGLATLGTVLNSMKATPVIKDMVNNGGKPAGDAEDRSAWTLATWNEKDPEGLEKLNEAEKEKLYTASYPAK